MKISDVILAIVMTALCAPGVCAERPPRVLTSLLPVGGLIEEIGGRRLDVTVLVPPGANPHTYEPTPGQMKEADEADVYIKAGTALEFEQIWLPKIVTLNPSLTVIDASKGVRLLPMGEHDDHGHEGHHHDHGEMDPHIWLSLPNLIVMTATIRDALIEFDPAGAKTYRERAAALIGRLDEAHSAIRASMEGLTRKAFFIFHPAWGYFANDYGLEQIVVEYQGKEPSARDIVRLVRQARQSGARAIFTEPQYSQRAARVIADEIGGRVVEVDPLAEDVVGAIEDAAGKILDALKDASRN